MDARKKFVAEGAGPPVNPGDALVRVPGAPSVAGMVESIVGCKWSVAVLAAIREGTQRPGALERRVTGISAKVLAERLDKLLRFGLIERRSYAESPPRVEYSLTALGARFCTVLDAVQALERELERGGEPGARGADEKSPA
jgi:DNA-binding HxlR family transcriptional regulator